MRALAAPTGGVRAGPAELTNRIAWWLFVGGITLYMTLSAQSLFHLGIPYDAPGGALVVKIHPGTWLIVLSYALLLAARGHPFRVGAAQLASEPLLAVYVACQTLVLMWVLSQHGGSGATNVVDSLIMPFFCVAVVAMLDTRQRHQLLALVVSLLVFNTLVGIAESMLQVKLIPLRIGGAVETAEDIFRPSAMLGHPLTNSMVTATLIPAALYLRIGMAWRVAVMLLLWVGTLTFGGRTGFVLATLAFGLYFPIRIAASALQGRFSYLQLTGGALVATLAAGLVAGGIAATGIGERIFKTLEWDGSANVRVQIWSVFDYLHTRELLFGISPTEIIAVGYRMGLAESEAIENFWLVMFLQTGIVGFVPFMLAMACAFVWMWKSSRGAMRVAVLLFFAIGSSNNSLATKTIAMAMFMTVLALTRRQPVPA